MAVEFFSFFFFELWSLFLKEENINFLSSGSIVTTELSFNFEKILSTHQIWKHFYLFYNNILSRFRLTILKTALKILLFCSFKNSLSGLPFRPLILVCNRPVKRLLDTYSRCFQNIDAYVHWVDPRLFTLWDPKEDGGGEGRKKS